MRKKRTYGHGMAERPEDPTRCIEAVWEPGRGVSMHQCTRKRTQGRYCKQHDPVAKRKANDAAEKMRRLRYADDARRADVQEWRSRIADYAIEFCQATTSEDGTEALEKLQKEVAKGEPTTPKSGWWGKTPDP